MDWKLIAALAVFGLAIVLGLVIVMYASVSRYARTFDPANRATPRLSKEDRISR